MSSAKTSLMTMLIWVWFKDDSSAVVVKWSIKNGGTNNLGTGCRITMDLLVSKLILSARFI